MTQIKACYNYYMDLKEHLLSRHCNLELHRPVIDEVEGVAAFYLWSLTGRLCGYQQYRPSAGKDKHNHPKEGRYYTYRTPSTFCPFGVESLHLNQNVVFLTEGVFDATRITNRGLPALASLSNDPKKEFGNLLWFLNRKVVAVCDNDAAGRKLAKFGNFVEYTQDKDLGDSDESYVTYLLEKYS